MLLLAGIVLGCYVYQMGKTFKIVTGTVKKVTKQPFSVVTSCFLECSSVCNLLCLHLPHNDKGLYEDVPEAKCTEIHPVQMTNILRDVFHDPQTAHKYAKHLDKKVQAESSASP